MANSIGIVILAAGKGTRMRIDTPKALALCAGRPLLDYVVEASMNFANHSSLKAEIGVVVGHQKELLERWLHQHEMKTHIKTAWQKEQKGTADALMACFKDLPHFWNHDFTMVLCADTPLLSEAEFDVLFKLFMNNEKLVGVAATFETANPTGYGRIVPGGSGFKIIEEKDADDMQRRISEVNSGVYIFKTQHVKEVLGKISNNNKAGEFYLTDLFQQSFAVENVKFKNEIPFLGINTLEQLAYADKVVRTKKVQSLMLSGVRFLNPESTYIESEVQIGAGSTIYPGCTILGKTKIGENVTIESNTLIRNCVIDNFAEILASSHLDEAVVGEKASIGPMARLRPMADIGAESKVGNFVEIKKSKLAPRVKVSHLSYVGDAEIGEDSNIGCGFITCNYDGANKHKTKIGSGTFIGSACQLIAPIEIGNDAFVAAGSTITKDVTNGTFAIARGQQVNKEGVAKRFLKTKKV
jgi:bifunctional UDP-N-acetylglucosamine pyrophosphorylase / glucosamine-1-phosphate N-acetyltransferase